MGQVMSMGRGRGGGGRGVLVGCFFCLTARGAVAGWLEAGLARRGASWNTYRVGGMEAITTAAV